MPQTLTAVGRITCPVTIENVTHKVRYYVRNPQATGGTYNINSRATDANDTPWLEAASAVIEAMTYMYGTPVTFNDPYLETRVGAVWTLVAGGVPTYTGHTSFSNFKGYQFTLTLRDVNFKKIKVVLAEPNNGGLAVYKGFNGQPAGAVTGFVKEFTPDHVLDHAPYTWMVSMSNQYLNTAPVISSSIWTNRKTKRTRGL